MWLCAVWGTSVTHTKDLRARVVANTILFLFILQKLKVQVVSHDPTTSQLPLVLELTSVIIILTNIN